MLTKRLAEFVINTQAVPTPAMSAAADALIDTVGVALAGTLEESSEIVQRWIQETAAKPVVTLWGTHLRSSAADAAFANGIASHALDFDDSLPTLRGHPSTTLAPAVFAAAEASGATGKATLEAFSIGVEIAGILGKAVGAGHYVRGWHTTSTIGVFSATAAAARLFGLTVKQLQNAWGIAASETSGLVCNFGTMTKPFHAGHAARSAVVAATLARAGFTANPDVFDGKESFFHTYAGDDAQKLEDLVKDLGKQWQILEPGIYVKRWPCCYCNHRALGGLQLMVAEHGLQLDDIQTVQVGFLPGSDNALVSEDPQTGLSGKFSIEYCVAALLIDGKVTLDSFTDAMVQRSEIRKVMKKVHRVRIEAKGLFSGVVGYTDLTVVTSKGEFKKRVDNVPGSPEWPMTKTDRADKFFDSAGRVLGLKGATQLFEALNECATFNELREIIKLTVPDTVNPKQPTEKRVSV
jgi:2-methylcitrate dehydratase PrpD